MRGSPFAAGVLISLALALWPQPASPRTDKPECIAPAKPGGGFDLTCQLVRTALLNGKLTRSPMQVTHMPGGVGAVAYSAIVSQRPGDGNAIIAFSSGSLLNLAQGKFGQYTEADVRWLAAIAADCGAIAVRPDSPFRSLKDLVMAITRDPAGVVFGVGGTIGGQDWMKAALVFRAAGLSPKRMRYVSFEGGGEAFIAMQGGHVQVVTGDIGEGLALLEAGKIRLLATLSEQRLPGKLAGVPTAKEQGVPVSWPIVRGFYMGPKVAESDYGWWADTFRGMVATPGYTGLREAHGLLPFSLIGAELRPFVTKTVQDYATVAAEFGLVKR